MLVHEDVYQSWLTGTFESACSITPSLLCLISTHHSVAYEAGATVGHCLASSHAASLFAPCVDWQTQSGSRVMVGTCQDALDIDH